uniref:Uncharacterized protein n=1 Tax=Cucumis melo TaxID=3656 RepID=A0A9I9DWQ4_CUCME
MIEFALPFVYLLVAGLQIWHLKTFFEKKKAIICTYIVYWYPPYYKQKPNFFDPWSLVSSSSFGISCNGIHFGILGIENFNHKKNFTLALEGVPIFGLHNRTATYRFVTLVDVSLTSYLDIFYFYNLNLHGSLLLL